MNTAALAAVLTVAQFGPPPGWVQDGPVLTRDTMLLPIVVVERNVPIVPTFGQPTAYVRDVERILHPDGGYYSGPWELYVHPTTGARFARVPVRAPWPN